MLNNTRKFGLQHRRVSLMSQFLWIQKYNYRMTCICNSVSNTFNSVSKAEIIKFSARVIKMLYFL